MQQLKQQVDPEALVLFICRSGARSHNAATAAAAAGYTQGYNVIDGFEGRKDTQNHRDSVGGWRFSRVAAGSSRRDELYDAVQSTSAVYAVTSTATPNTIRYQANTVKSCLLM